jgi:hypothetical protein
MFLAGSQEGAKDNYFLLFLIDFLIQINPWLCTKIRIRSASLLKIPDSLKGRLAYLRRSQPSCQQAKKE